MAIHGICNVLNPRAPFAGVIPHNPAMAVPSISLAIIKDITINFSDGNMIGQGGFSVVYKVRACVYVPILYSLIKKCINDHILNVKVSFVKTLS
jgi:hypothetical protein